MQSELGSCFVPQRLVDEILTEADRHSPLETGGVLLGVTDAMNVWVDAVVGPGPKAQRSACSFEPDADYQDSMIAMRYEEHGRSIAYLGDWHTHPNSSPHLSWRDRRTLRTIASDPAARQPLPLMMIFGEGRPWRVLAWRYTGAPWYSLKPAFLTMTIVFTD